MPRLRDLFPAADEFPNGDCHCGSADPTKLAFILPLVLVCAAVGVYTGYVSSGLFFEKCERPDRAFCRILA